MVENERMTFAFLLSRFISILFDCKRGIYVCFRFLSSGKKIVLENSSFAVAESNYTDSQPEKLGSNHVFSSDFTVIMIKASAHHTSLTCGKHRICTKQHEFFRVPGFLFKPSRS